VTEQRTETDVIIIGAGLAGLSAAHEAAAKGLTVALLEARDRIGGRVWTTFERGHTHPIEMGAEWIANEGRVRSLLESHGATLYHADGHHWVRTSGGVEAMREVEDVTSPVLSKLKDCMSTESQDISLREALDRCAGDLPREDVQSLLGYVEGFHAADRDKLSTKWLLQVEESQSADESQIRCDDGNNLISECILRSMGLRVTPHLDHVVHRVEWSRGSVSVTARHRAHDVTLHSSKLIVTVPLGVLKAAAGEPGAITFNPPLAKFEESLSKVEVGHVLRMSFSFRRAFWNEIETMPDLLFAQKFDEKVPTWWRADPLGAPILIGWAASRKLQALEGLQGETLRDAALHSLAATLDVPFDVVLGEFESWHVHDWNVDPFTRGAYSYVGVGGVDAWRELSKSLDDTVWLAGEAIVGEGLNGTMEGAIASGERAAKAVIDSESRK
jgi:monoamine oxidase